MYLIDKNATKREMLLFLTGVSKNHVVAICMNVIRATNKSLTLYGTKGSIISGLENIDTEILWNAIETVIEPRKNYG